MERGQGNSKKETDVEGKKKKNTDRQCKTQSLQVLLETLNTAGRIQHKNEDCSLRATNNKENYFIVGKPRKLILLI